MMREVINYTMYWDNPYHKLLYSNLDGQYKAVKGTLDQAITAQRSMKAGDRQILHMHWEEAIVRKVKTNAEAEAIAQYFCDRLEYFKKVGGFVVWTVHNILPHELEHLEPFMKIRRHLMAHADRILIHNLETINALKSQGQFDFSKIFHLPHAAYLDNYGAPELPKRANRKQLLLFGKVRRYKGIDIFLKDFLNSDMPSKGFNALVRGGTINNDSFGEEVTEKFGDKGNIKLDFTHVPDNEVKGLFLNSACLVLPYTRFLTSGSLMAAMAHGLPTIAPNSPQMKEVLPSSAHEFLFDVRKKGACIEAVKRLNSLSSKNYKNLRMEMMDRALYYHPHSVSSSLGAVYESRLF